MRSLLGITAFTMLAVSGSSLVTIARANSRVKVARLVVNSPTLTHGFDDKNVLNGYGCAGGNVSPVLQWSGAPAGTKSFVVTLYDPDDHDNPSGWWHWVVYNLPSAVSALPANAGSDHEALLPTGALHGRTDLGTLNYTGPCPDKGDAPHRYTFTVYALDVATLAVDSGASGAMVVETAREHLLGKGDLVVRFGR